MIKGLVSKETAVLRQWGVETNVWFINRVGKEIPLSAAFRALALCQSESRDCDQLWLHVFI